MTSTTSSSGKNPTVFEVAQHAGVSAMTVSRVLSGGEQVAPATRERVLSSVRALGYQRNNVARALRPGQRSCLIGVVVSNIDNPYYSQLVIGIEERANESGRRILLAGSSEDDAREREIIADFLGWRVEGLIAVPTGSTATWQPQHLGGIPVVFASRTLPSGQGDSVVIDDTGGAREVTARLLARGHTRIAFLGNSDRVSTGRRRYRGYRDAHEAAGLAVDPGLVVRGQPAVANARDSAMSLLAVPGPPTAVFATNNRYGVGLLQAMAKLHGHHPANGPAIAVFDPFELSELVPWPLMTLRHDPRELGRQAADLLLRRLDNELTGPPQHTTLTTSVLEQSP
ncbi:LacI family DNA-binding transcriptional regulator [Propionibacteriaceae bacterium Y2011]